MERDTGVLVLVAHPSGVVRRLGTWHATSFYPVQSHICRCAVEQGFHEVTRPASRIIVTRMPISIVVEQRRVRLCYRMRHSRYERRSVWDPVVACWAAATQSRGGCSPSADNRCMGLLAVPPCSVVSCSDVILGGLRVDWRFEQMRRRMHAWRLPLLIFLGVSIAAGFLILVLGPIAMWASPTAGLHGIDKANVINATRQILLAGAAGIVVLAGGIFTARTCYLSRRG